MFDFVESVIAALETGEAVVLATIAGPDDALDCAAGRKLVVTLKGVEGTLGSRGLDERVAGEATRMLQQAPRSKLLLLALTTDEARQLGVAEAAQLAVFLDVMLPPATLLVVGAGHIAQPLSRMGELLDFRVVVMDDRPSFANRERFPEAHQVLCGRYAELLASFPSNRSTYAVIVTRGHAQDEEALRAIVRSDVAYIGMIGSPRRVGGVLGRLAGEGVPRDLLERVRAPIGLDIGAESPAEIAVSIVAEVISVQRRGLPHPSSLSKIRRVRENDRPVP